MFVFYSILVCNNLLVITWLEKKKLWVRHSFDRSSTKLLKIMRKQIKSITNMNNDFPHEFHIYTLKLKHWQQDATGNWWFTSRYVVRSGGVLKSSLGSLLYACSLIISQMRDSHQLGLKTLKGTKPRREREREKTPNRCHCTNCIS